MTTKLSQESSESSRRTFFGRTLASAGAAVMATALTNDRTLGQEHGVLPQGGQRIVIASQAGAKLDSNVETGGGTDDTHVLQAVLDKAVEWGSLHLIMDGAALTAGLRVHANTTIECLNQACGFFPKANTNQPVLTNANPRFVGERIDKNILLLGGTYNNQATLFTACGRGTGRAACIDGCGGASGPIGRPFRGGSGHCQRNGKWCD